MLSLNTVKKSYIYKNYTNKDGMHFFNVFVQKPFIAPPPENEPYSYDWSYLITTSGALRVALK